MRKILALGGLLALMGCAPDQPPTTSAEPTVTPAVATPAASYKPQPGVKRVGQNWGEADARWYYNVTQGSQIVHFDLVKNLEQAGNSSLFLSDGLARYGYFPPLSPDKEWNPDNLPVGFAKDQGVKDKQAWLGMTCAACHTGRVEYQGQVYQVDGAPSLSDLGGFLTGLNDALTASLSQKDKFARLTQRMLGDKPTPKQVAALKQRLTGNQAHVAQILDKSASDTWGHARTDAFGMIFNRVTGVDLGYAPNKALADAPVSYPHLWNTGRFNWIQWNAVVPNKTDLDKLGRNAGEVLGVFGTAKLVKSKLGYNSSVRMRNLGQIENLVEELSSPSWGSVIGPVDEAKANRGAALYAENCVSCHALLTNPKAPIEVTRVSMDQVKTDPTMNVNAVRRVETRQLAGSSFLGSKPLESNDLGVNLLANAVTGTIVYKGLRPETDPVSKLPSNWKWQAPLKKPSEGAAMAPASVYKARPLNGIWATAPYLHNGSVPTLYDVLLPADQRPKKFKVGSIAFDATRVGYVSDVGPTTFDTSLKANSNAGHAYADHLTEAERWDLVEYLKKL